MIIKPLFLLIAMWFVTSSCVAKPTTTTHTKTEDFFADPEFDGMPIDYCRLWASECGKPAADAFCKSKGYQKSTGHEVHYDVGLSGVKTYVIDSRLICAEPTCDALANVRCEKTE